MISWFSQQAGQDQSGLAKICDELGIEQKKNRVDIGVRVELPAEVFKDITDAVYEGKIVYKTDRYNDMVRTFCMNPYGGSGI